MKKIFLFSLISFYTLSCTVYDHPAPSPAATCKLSRFFNYTGTNDFTYDSAGYVSKWVVTKVLDTLTIVLTNKFTRNSAGQLATLYQTFTFNGKNQNEPSTTRFTFANGLLTNTNVFFDTTKSPVISRTFSYDTNKRMSKRVSVINPTGFIQTDTYEYDSRGNCTRYVYTDTDGFKDEQVFTYDNSKNPEQLLIKSIPFNFYLGLPWSVNVAITSQDTFDDGTGPYPPLLGKRIDVKTDNNGYVIAATEIFEGVETKESYTLIDCK